MRRRNGESTRRRGIQVDESATNSGPCGRMPRLISLNGHRVRPGRAGAVLY